MAEIHFKMTINEDSLQPGAKGMIGHLMYGKGKSFFRAGSLLNDQEGNDFVVLYLFCQGFEVMLKGLLLMKDYERFKPQLKKLGHDLVKIANVTSAEFGLHPPDGEFLRELEQLNRHYGKEQLLRYGTMYDLFVDPKDIKTDAFLRKLLAIFRLAGWRVEKHYRSLFTQRRE